MEDMSSRGGFIAVISVAFGYFIFRYWFARKERLWPVIIAHGILDFVALAARV
jgi:membrane protease YdiL (CAAX protease family)